MKKQRLFCAMLALAMSASVAFPAMAKSPQKNTAQAEQKKDSSEALSAEQKTATVKMISPLKLRNILSENMNSIYNDMDELYASLPDDGAAILDSAAEDYLLRMVDLFQNLEILVEIDEDEDIPYSYETTETRLWDNFNDGSAVSLRNSEQSIVAYYAVDGKLKDDVVVKNNILTEEAKKAALLHTTELKIQDADYYVKVEYIRAQNRMRVNFGTKEGLWDLGGVDLVYRGENSVFLQVFMPVDRIPSLSIREPYEVMRILVQKDSFRMSQTYRAKEDISSLRLAGGYGSWEKFAFEDSNTFYWQKNSFKVLDPNGQVYYDSKGK